VKVRVDRRIDTRLDAGAEGVQLQEAVFTVALELVEQRVGIASVDAGVPTGALVPTGHYEDPR
jgi:hypothetical protein